MKNYMCIHTVMVMCGSVLLRWGNISANVVAKISTHHLCSILIFPENRVGHEIMWQNIVETKRSQMAI